MGSGLFTRNNVTENTELAKPEFDLRARHSLKFNLALGSNRFHEEACHSPVNSANSAIAVQP